MNKPYNIQNTNICNGIFHISFFKALLINEGERESGRNDPGRTGIGAKRPAVNENRGETTQGANGIRGETTWYLIIYWTRFSAHCLSYIHIDTTFGACV